MRRARLIAAGQGAVGGGAVAYRLLRRDARRQASTAERTVTVERSAEDLYALSRDFGNAPRGRGDRPQLCVPLRGRAGRRLADAVRTPLVDRLHRVDALHERGDRLAFCATWTVWPRRVHARVRAARATATAAR